MARPAMNSKLTNKHLTNEEKQLREYAENQLKGNCDKLKPPNTLNNKQKEIFYYIYNELIDKEILSNLDLFILTKTAITLEKMFKLDELNIEDMNTTQSVLQDRLTKQFFRCCSELCLSPQARSKLAVSFKPQEEDDPLLKILGLN